MNSTRDTVKNAGQVCLFGVGTLMHHCFDQLITLLGRKPDCLCDSLPSKWGTEYFGIPCISPDELAKRDKETLVIITIRRYEEAREQLFKMGIKNVFAACFDSGYYVLHTLQTDDISGPVNATSSNKPTDTGLEGKWTLITGAARGVGRQTAIAMAGLGSNIIAHSRNLSHVDELIENCADLGVQVVPVAAELSNLAETEKMLSDLNHMVPQVDIIFNNAAISPPYPDVWSIPGKDFIDILTINTISPIRICQHLIPSMLKRNFGKIINLSTNIQDRPPELAYACSKAAFDKFTYDLTPTLEDTGVMMTLVDPGWVRTDSGGPTAPNTVESVVPGILLGALLGCEFNGRRFNAQDFSGLSLDNAIQKAQHHYRLNRSGRLV